MIKPPEKFIRDFLKKFDRVDLLILLTTFIAGLITNFYFFIGHGLSPDALSENYHHIAGPWELQLGRFSLQFLDQFRFGFVNQLLIILLALGFMSGALMLIRRLFNLKNRLYLFLLCLIVATAPQFTETYMYLYCADSYLLAFFSATLAVYALSKITSVKHSKSWILLAILSTILVSSLYQAYLGVLLGLLIIYTIKTILESNENSLKNLPQKTKQTSSEISALKRFFQNLLIILFSIGLYYIIFRIVCRLNHLRPSSYKGANGLGIETLLALPKNIANAFTDFYNFFFADEIIINNNFYFRQFLYLILAAVLIFTIVQIFKRQKFSKSLLTLILILLFPIFVNIMNLIASGTRINLVTGPGIITTAVLFIYLVSKLTPSSFSHILHWITSSTLFLLAWTFLLADTYTYIVRNNQYNDFKTIAANIHQKATTLENYQPDLPFLFSNVIETPAREYEKTTGMVTRNTISWTGYAGVQRYEEFFRKFLGLNIHSATEQQYLKIVNNPEFKAMPTYPANDSVKIIDDIIVIKITNSVLINEQGEVKLW
ncbi:hypothetical protein EUA78_00100 [TM7 phylum sp. oral taxon 351]|nr:hypothetical protein EUA78_00100 [TM7 phylum sp. oral taxon 351]